MFMLGAKIQCSGNQNPNRGTELPWGRDGAYFSYHLLCKADAPLFIPGHTPTRSRSPKQSLFFHI